MIISISLYNMYIILFQEQKKLSNPGFVPSVDVGRVDNINRLSFCTKLLMITPG